MKTLFCGKTVLITGGTGSFGNAFLEYLLPMDCKEIRIFSRDELKQEQMRVALKDSRVKFYIGDVRDRSSIDSSMNTTDYVFHAAALKQVPSCEFFPMQAVLTNIVGSSNVIEAAVYHKVKRLVVLSTDKAVYPINAMGMTKALMVKVAQAKARELTEDKTIITSVRYGNVMASRGSVIPLFIKQIVENKQITITVPEMTRFLLPLPLAVNLVAFAFKYGEQGDLFVRKSPACTVIDLARALKELFNSDVPIKIIGIRHGEKIFETLASQDELANSEDMGDYYRIPMDNRELNYNKFFTEGETIKPQVEDYTSHNTERLNLSQVKDLLLSLNEVKVALSKHVSISNSSSVTRDDKVIYKEAIVAG